MIIIEFNRQLGLTESQKEPMKTQHTVKALIVHYTNSKDIMKKKVCFNMDQVNKVYTYGFVQHITDANGQPVGLMEADHFFDEVAV